MMQISKLFRFFVLAATLWSVPAAACTLGPSSYYLEPNEWSLANLFKSPVEILAKQTNSNEKFQATYFQGTVLKIKKVTPPLEGIFDEFAELKVTKQLSGRIQLPTTVKVHVIDGRRCCLCGMHLTTDTTGTFGILTLPEGIQTLATRLVR